MFEPSDIIITRRSTCNKNHYYAINVTGQLKKALDLTPLRKTYMY